MPIPIGLGIAASVIGNLLSGDRARKAARKADNIRKETREEIQQLNKQPLQEILDYRDTARQLAQSTKNLALDRSDRAFSSAMDAIQAGDPRTAGLLNKLYEQDVMTGMNIGAQTQKDILAADQPLVQEAARSRDVEMNLLGADYAQTQEALQSAQAAQEAAFQNMVNLPTSLMALSASANPESTLGQLFDVGKDGTYIKNMQAGGALAEILNQGDSMVTGGLEEHSVNEKALVDLEDGEVEALITGQERVEAGEDGVAVTNSEQERGMFDAFKSVKDKDKPSQEELERVYQSVLKVYSQPQFNPSN